MTTDIPRIYRKRDKEKKRIDIEYLTLPKQQQQLKESIKKEINDRKLKETISTQERWKLLPNIMKETAGKTLGRKDRMERTNDRKVQQISNLNRKLREILKVTKTGIQTKKKQQRRKEIQKGRKKKLDEIEKAKLKERTENSTAYQKLFQ